MFKNTLIILNNKKGQVSIFLAMGLMSIMAMLAFVINVGMFVKAKINLQNAVDAAAWAGAATQARQLSKIAHLNWELRNTYKEWMFKYYVLGSLGLETTKTDSIGDKVQFRLAPFQTNTLGIAYNGDAFDKYNVPSICIHQGSSYNICKIASIPGLPRFSSVGLINVSQNHEAILDEFSRQKSTDCSRRTIVNYLAAINWAYGIGKNDSASYPQIASSRPGAWIKSIEIALRIRNIEMHLNTPPAPDAICASLSKYTGPCTPISNVDADLVHERTHKAFFSAYKNLGGGKLKDGGSEGTDELSANFTLTELAPLKQPRESTSLSGFLIPTDSQALNKQYVDLIINPINYATFFTFFTTRSINGVGVPEMEGGCSGTKTALPIPGYITGFYKSPKVLTYYAVKGKTKYLGLLNPFANEGFITLQAYAAAKPMGGRIGPRLFDTVGKQSLVPRQNRTAAFASVLNATNLSGPYKMGYPIPTSQDFWALPDDNIGGTPSSTGGGEIKYVIPNMIYGFESSVTDIADQAGSGASSKLLTLDDVSSLAASIAEPPENKGLYSGLQYKMLRKKLDVADPSNATISAESVLRAISKVRAPTKYDLLNYMVPVVTDDKSITSGSNENNADASIQNIGNLNYYSFSAPLYGDNTLFPNGPANIESVISSYLEALKPSINTFIDALKTEAERMKSTVTSGTDTYKDAADTIWQPGYQNISGKCHNPNDQSKVSLAGRTYQFFQGESEKECGIKTLASLVKDYINSPTSPNFPTTFTALYNHDDDPDVYSAFSPGPRQGATNDGTKVNPYFAGDTKRAKRNFYSTKFFNINKVVTGQTAKYGDKGAIFLERGALTNEGNFEQSVENYLDNSSLDKFGNLYY